MQIGVITNPNSRKNKDRPNRASQLQTIVGDFGEVHETDNVECIKPVLRNFLRKKARYWVADGGDGALHWMLRMGMEVLDEEEFAGASLPMTLPTNGGTIDFIAHNVGIHGDAEALLGGLRGQIEGRKRIEDVEVDSMLIEGTRVVDGRDESFRTYGFGVAAGGIGQRFFSKYYQHEDPSPRTIVKVLATAIASTPVAYSPLRALPGMPKGLRTYAKEIFQPTPAKIMLDGMELPDTQFTGVHIASMSIRFGNLLSFFNKADEEGLLHTIMGTPSPLTMIRNLPRMYRGKTVVGRGVIDRPCREMSMEAVGNELLDPIIDGEYYRNVKQMTFKVGPRLRIPKVVSAYQA